MQAEHIDAIKAELGRSEYDGLSVDDAYARLHVVTHEAETALAPLSVAEVWAAISPVTHKQLARHPMLDSIRQAIQSQDREAVAVWVQVLLDGGVIDAADADAIRVLLGRTVEVLRDVPPRIIEAFGGIEGMPNAIDQADFAAAYQEVRG